MLFSLFLSVIYFAILFFFGWQLAQYFLKENRIEHLLPLSGIFGIGFYVFLINAIGHFIAIQTTFYLVLAVFLLAGLFLFRFNRSQSLRWELEVKWRKILLGSTLLLVIVSGIVSFRSPPQQQASVEPLAATIAEGNFPPLEIWQPKYPLFYHYARELFSAAIHKITGLPLYLALDFQVAVLVGILFLLGFILIKKFCRNNLGALVASLMMLYLGSLNFLKSIGGFQVLYNFYIRHQEVSAPFKFVGDAMSSEFSAPAINFMSVLSTVTLAFPLIIAIIYLYFSLVSQKVYKINILFVGVLLALLALAAEAYFAVLSLMIFIYPLITRNKKTLVISLAILAIAWPIALVQGGVLTGMAAPYLPLGLGNGYVFSFDTAADNFFTINKTPWFLPYFEFDGGTGFAIYHPKFLMEFGLIIILLIPSSLFLFKKYKELADFIVPFCVVSFLIPFFITFSNSTHTGDMTRFFYPINLLGGLIIGLFLASLYGLLKKGLFKIAIIFVAIVLAAQGLIFQAVFLSVGYPAGVWNAAAESFVPQNSSEEKAYDWIRENTTINDRILIIKNNYEGRSAINYEFIVNTGRMAPIYTYFWDQTYWSLVPPSPEFSSFQRIKKDCNSSDIKSLNYSYLYVNDEWTEGMEERCLANNDLELRFEAGEGEESIRIYRILN